MTKHRLLSFPRAAWRRALVSGAWSCALAAGTSTAAGLNDTGVTTCADAAGATVSCTALTAVQGQDARYGRDAAAGTSALTKVGGGANGFDFTKISNAGAALPANAVLGPNPGDWGCTYDNTTGLMWEVKTTSGLRYSNHYYSWFSSNSATNGGNAGLAAGGSCATVGRCDTEKFVQDVNASTMCGHDDWRLPTIRELLSIARLASITSVDGSFFPDGKVIGLWSGSSSASNATEAWMYSSGNPYSLRKNSSIGYNSGNYYGVVRLVRYGQ